MSKKTPFELRYDLLNMAHNMLNPRGDTWVNPDRVIELAHKLNAFVSDTEPTRKVFSVDVGNMKPDEAAAIIDTIKRGINKQVLFEDPEQAIKNLKRSFELEEDEATVIERIQATQPRDVHHIHFPRMTDALKLSPEEIAENERLWAEEMRLSQVACEIDAGVAKSLGDPTYNPLDIMEDYFRAGQAEVAVAAATSPEAAVDACIDTLDKAKSHWAEAAKSLELELGGCLGGKKDCNGGSDTCTCGNDAGC